MAMPTDKTMMEAWKRQLDAAMRLTEAVIEGSQRMREVQIEAAANAHADAVATQKALAGASGPDELMRIQTEWLAANQRKSVEYWRRLYEAAAETNTQVMTCLRESMPKSD
ncbi:MAG: phasin family protein [Betaproteobacteria bacterium]|nr:phasin family protein [Betaproteobacteria bacterium]